MIGDKFYNLNTGTWCIITDIKPSWYDDSYVTIWGNRWEQNATIPYHIFEKYYITRKDVQKAEVLPIRWIPKYKFVDSE